MVRKATEESKYYKVRRERFNRVAELRVNNVLIALRRLGHAGNRMNYSYQANEVLEMFDAIKEAVHAAQEEFTVVEKPEPKAFKFKSKE